MNLYTEFSAMDVSAHIIAGYIGLSRYGFHPYGLPYAGHRSVPDTAGIAYLLTPRDGILRVVGRVPYFHDELRRAILQIVRHIYIKRCESPGVADGKSSVKIDFSSPIDSIEMQQNPLPVPFGRPCNRGPVPQKFIFADSPAYSRQR